MLEAKTSIEATFTANFEKLGADTTVWAEGADACKGKFGEVKTAFESITEK